MNQRNEILEPTLAYSVGSSGKDPCSPRPAVHDSMSIAKKCNVYGAGGIQSSHSREYDTQKKNLVFVLASSHFPPGTIPGALWKIMQTPPPIARHLGRCHHR